MKANQLIVVYDDCCNLCSVLARWLSVVNKKKKLAFKTQQYCASHLYNHKEVIDHLSLADELIVIYNGSVFGGTQAVFAILRELGGGYTLMMRFLQLFPKSFIDLVYSWIARNRYYFWGRRKACSITPPLT